MSVDPETAPSPRELLSELLGALRAADNVTVARTALLLGVLCETTGAPAHTTADTALGEVVAALDGARHDNAATTAMLYLLAHFPGRRDLVLSGVDVLGADPDDLARLERCLRAADPHDPGNRARLGRSWPSPLVWRLTPAERELDTRWRETLNLDAASFRRYWDGETAALLAFLGAKAAYAGRAHDDSR